MSIPDPSPIKYIYFFTFCFFLSMLLNSILLKFSRNLGKRNTREYLIRWANEQKPSLGGISFYITFLVGYSVYTLFFNQATEVASPRHIGILMACGVAFLMGLSDDAYNTKPLLKFSTQIFCGLIMITTGTYITIFPNDYVNYVLTIFWVVAIMNSINMLDNMDGVTTIVSLIIVGTALMIGVYNFHNPSSPFLITSMIAVAAALCGFLIYNWHPAKMFMGDTGSQFLGIFLAAISIIYFWNYKDPSGMEAGSKQLTFVGLAFIIPIIDTVSVVVNRIRRGQSPLVGGKDHTTHHLSYHGLSDRKVALVMGGLSFVSMGMIWGIMQFIDSWNLWIAGAFFAYFVANFLWIYRITRLHRIRDLFNKIASGHERKKQVEERLDV